MKFKIDDFVISNDGKIGVIIDCVDDKYVVKNINGIWSYFENELKEWHGIW